jgi:hypothetical protein
VLEEGHNLHEPFAMELDFIVSGNLADRFFICLTATIPSPAK